MSVPALLLAVAIGAAAMPTTASARPGSPTATSLRARCYDWFNSLGDLVATAHPVVATPIADDGCRYVGVVFGGFSEVEYDVATLEVRGIDFDPSRDFGPPMSIRAEARGIRETRRGLGGAQAWMLLQTQSAFDVVVDATVDPIGHVAVLHELSMTGERIGRVELDGVVEGIDTIDRPDSGEFGLRALHGRLDSGTFITSFVLPAALGLISEPDPAASVAQGRLLVSVFLRDALPRAGASTATVDAVLGMIADLPRPRHPFELTLSVPGGPVTPGDVERAADGPDGVAALMGKLRIEASYDGAFRP